MRAQIILCMLVLLALPAAADNWPQWRGPRNDGTTAETGLATRWSATENVRWRLELPGPGPSTPIVWGDRLFLTAATGENELVLLAVDRGGRKLWQTVVGQGNYSARGGESNAAAPSPSTDGKHVWVLFGNGLVGAYDFEGQELWKADLVDRYGELKYFFGLSSSPLLDADRLYLLVLHSNAQLVLALDKATGREVWRHERRTDARHECLHSYASPVMYRHDGTEALIIHGGDYVTGHGLADGVELWRQGDFNPKDGYNPSLRFVATPTVHEGVLYVPSAKNGPVVALDPRKVEDGASKQVWRLADGTPDVPSPVIHGGVVYLSRENGILTALDAATGEPLYSERVHGRPHRGSPLYGDGKVYLMGSDGTVSVVRAGRSYELLAQNSIDEHLAASLAVSEGTIYLRTWDALYAIAESQSPR